MTGAGRLQAILERIDGWGAEHASAAMVGPTGLLAAHGDLDHRYRWASATKLVTALTVLIAAERGLLELDEPAGPPGATGHLLAHTSGLPFEGASILARPGSRRIYSNPGFDALGALVAERAGVPFDVALAEWVLEPLGMGLRNSPETFGHFGGSGTFLWVDPVADLALVVLTDREFGPWSLEAWPAFSDEVLTAASR